MSTLSLEEYMAVTEDKNDFEKNSQLEEENSYSLNEFEKIKSENKNLKLNLSLAAKEISHLKSENNLLKLEGETEIFRLSMELEQAKKEIESKNIIITRLIESKNIFTQTSLNSEEKTSDNLKPSISLKNIPIKKLEFLTPLTNNKIQKIPEKFMQSYSKSFLNIKRDSFIKNIFENYEFHDLQPNQSEKINRENIRTFVSQTSSKDFQNSVNMNKNVNPAHKQNDIYDDCEDEEEMEFIRQRIDNEIQNILENRKKFILNTLMQENFSFDIIENKSTPMKNSKTQEYFANTYNNNNTNDNLKYQKKDKMNQKFIQNMNEVLQKIQIRKNKILTEKENLKSQLEKVGINII